MPATAPDSSEPHREDGGLGLAALPALIGIAEVTLWRGGETWTLRSDGD